MLRLSSLFVKQWSIGQRWSRFTERDERRRLLCTTQRWCRRRHRSLLSTAGQ